MLLVLCQLSRDVIGYEDLISNWCVSILLLSQLDSRLLLVKLSVLESFSRSYGNLTSSISRLYGSGNGWLRFNSVCSKLVNQLSKVLVCCLWKYFLRGGNNAL